MKTTKGFSRLPGRYKVKHLGEWIVAKWVVRGGGIANHWVLPGYMVGCQDNDFEVIEETRLEDTQL